jgi:hypothetical protein
MIHDFFDRRWPIEVKRKQIIAMSMKVDHLNKRTRKVLKVLLKI